MADYAGAVAAIEDRLRTMWTATPIGFENDKMPAVVGLDGMLQPWVLCEVLSTGSEIKGAGKPGDHVTIDYGMISLTVFVLRGSGRTIVRAHAVQLAEIFRTRKFYDVEPGVYVRTWTPEIGPGNPAKSENPSGSWWAVAVMTPFEFYHRA